MRCDLCPNRCLVDRTTKLGRCHATNTMHIARIAPHFFEEPPISGTRGSGTVFFAGCTMRCCYCQNHAISRAAVGQPFTPVALASELQTLVKTGVHNINLVTPTHYAHLLKETFSNYRPPVPVVYNTSGYERVSTLEMLAPNVSIYLPDFKYALPNTALALSGRKNYPSVALEAISWMRAAVTDQYDKDGILQSGLILRHLVLPNHIDNSLAVVELVAKHFPTTTLSLMAQFTPTAKTGKLSRPLLPLEYKIVARRAEALGLTRIFYQSPASASTQYLPDWNLLFPK